MKAHIVAVINSRTRGLAPVMVGNLSDEDSNHHASIDESMEGEDGELYRLETKNGSKTSGKGKIDRECYRCGRTGHIRACAIGDH